jgi:ubiquinone biosynthesis protein UbiJ
MEIKEIVVEDPENMHLLGLMLKLVLQNNKNRAKYLKYSLPIIALDVDGMKVTLRSEDGGVNIAKGIDGRAAACLKISMGALLEAAMRFNVVKPVLSGDLKISGNPLSLGKWLPLLLAH